MSETFQIEHNRLFRNLEEALKNDLASISVEANGGRSILFVYNMEDDDEYINEGRKRLPEDKFHFIDMRETFSDYIKSIGGEKVFNEMYANFGKEVYRSGKVKRKSGHSEVVSARAETAERQVP